MLKQSLQFKLLQKLSPQQIQLMKLLQLPTVALEQRVKEAAVEGSGTCGDTYKEVDGKPVYELATFYRGKFKIKMKSIQPNYDFTVYNMKEEP